MHIMMNKNRIKLLQEYLIDTTLRLIAEVAVWSLIVFYLYFYFPNSRFLSTRAAAIARNGYFMLLVPVLFVIWGLPRILRYARLFVCLVWDLIEQKTVSGNLKGMGATGPHRFLLTAKKQYADITKGWVHPLYTDQAIAQRKRNKTGWKKIRQKIYDKWKDFQFWMITEYSAIYRLLLIDSRVCSYEKLEGLMRTAFSGKSYPYVASKHAGIIFEFYAERKPEGVWRFEDAENG